MGLTCGVGIGLEGNVEVEVGGTIIGRGRETTGPIALGVVWCIGIGRGIPVVCTSATIVVRLLRELPV